MAIAYPQAPATAQPQAKTPMTPGLQSALGAYGAGVQAQPQAAAAPAQSPYLSAFQSALGASRADIQAQLQAALGDINSNRQAAQGALGQLPAGIDAAYGQMNNTVNASDATIAGAQKSAGIGSQTSLAQYMQPERAATAASQAYLHSQVPLLALGIQQQTASQQAAAHLAALGDESQLSQMQAQGALGMQQSLIGYQQQQGLQTQQEQFTGQQNALDRTAQADLAAGKTPANGAYAQTGLSQSQVATVKNSPQYNNIVKLIQNTPSSNYAELHKTLVNLYGTKNPTLLQVIAADFPGLK